MRDRLPRISIVVPSFNQGQFIGQTLASIFDQDYPNLEVVIMDGGSIDNSVQVIQSYNDRLTYWQSRPDKGQAHAINEGMIHCTGDLVAWLNSDDFYCENSLWIAARAFIKYPERGLYIGNGYRYPNSTQKRVPFCPIHIAFNRIALAEGLDYIQQPSTFILRKAWENVGGLNAELTYGFDWDLFLRISEKYTVVTINEFLSASREYADTKTARGKMERAIELIKIAQKRSGKQITLGTAFYLLGTLREFSGLILPIHIDVALSQAVDILKKEMAKSWGGDETFPIFSDPQDCPYLPISSGTSWVRKANARELDNLPCLSIVIPSPNHSQFISQALESILSQDYPQVEIIVVDSGPGDESAKILERYSNQITYFRSEPGHEPAQLIHKGFHVASGEILAWLSPDDLLGEGALWTIANLFLEDPILDMVMGNALYVGEDNKLLLVEYSGQITGFHYETGEPWRPNPAYWTDTRFLAQPTVFFRRQLIEKNFLTNESFAEGSFNFAILWQSVKEGRIKKIDSILSLYRIRNLTSQRKITIAVDMTLLLPGGENGGSKVLTMQLLDGLLRFAPQYHLLLLTTYQNHQELSFLDGPNVQRLCLNENQTFNPLAVNKRFRSRLKRILFKIYYSMPANVAKLAARIIRGAKNRFSSLFRFIRRIYESKQLLNSLGVDLLFCPFTTPTYAEPNIPVVSIFYDLQHLFYPQFFSQQEITRRDTQMDLIRRIADRTICISEHARLTLLRRLNLPPERAKTIYPAVQSRLVKPTSPKMAEVLSRLGLHKCPYIFYPANFWPHKNHQVLLEAYQMFLSGHPRYNLDLVFTGALEEPANKISILAKSMGLSERVHFLGFLHDQDFAAVLAGSQIMVFPSLYEGFGIPIIEAMSFGIPVLCSNETSLPEVAGDAALFFDPHDPQDINHCMREVLNNPNLASALIRKGYQRVLKFSTDNMIHEYMEVFTELTERFRRIKDTHAISGIFSDGWTSDRISLAYGPGLEGRFCEFSLAAPPWLPGGKVKIYVKGSGISRNKWVIKRGSDLLIRISLPSESGDLFLRVNPVFCPNKYGLSQDNRLLGCICNYSQIVHSAGGKKTLFELKTSLQ